MRRLPFHPVAQIRWTIVALLFSTLPAITWAQPALVPPLDKPPIEAPWALASPPASSTEPTLNELQPTNSNDSPAMRALILDVIKKNEADKKEAEDKKKKEEDKKKEEEGYKVGTALNMAVRWDNGLKFETPNKDFIMHVGARFQEDTVFWNQNRALRNAPTFDARRGIGDLQDGTFFRRVRLQLDGQLWEVVEWNMEYAPEQTSQSIPNVDEFWVGLQKLPVIGSLRVGHIKVPQGFEGDMVSSSKAMTFLERSAYTDAFYQNFAPGLWAGNSLLDQHVTWSAMWYRQEAAQHGSTGAHFGDGEYAFSARLTALPFYENDGRHMLHLGASVSYRDAEIPDPGLTGSGTVRFRARPQIRDAQGDFGTGTLPGNTNRMVDTAFSATIQANASTVIGAELFYVLGPFSLQSEWAPAIANEAVVNGVARDSLSFNGGYVQLSYFLTGENRIYDRRLGRLASNYLAGPFTPFFLTRGEEGGWLFGRGAWELATRFNYLNLNDGPIRGGVLTGFEAGVNWYLNANVKCQFEYLNENRYSLPANQVPGAVNGFATRVQIFY